MGTYVFNNDEEFSPSNEESLELVDQITNNYKNWDKDRNGQRDQYEKIEESLYVDVTHNDRNNDETILLPQIYEQYHTLMSNLEKSNFQNYRMMFGVEGKDDASQENATLQKANIEDALRNMKFEDEASEAMHHWLTKGEAIAFTYWDTEIEFSRRKVKTMQPIIDPISGMQMGEQEIEEIQKVPQVKYDGVKVTAIDPLNFVFDKNEVKNFLSCNKILYSLEDPYNVVNNQQYTLLKKDQKEYIKNMCQNGEDLTSDKYYMDGQTGNIGDQVVVLECWGDIKLKDGTVLKNYVATVVADRFLVRLEPNPYIRNPFTMSPWMPDPKSKRGRSPLLVAVPINQASSQILNGQLRGLKLALNPPVLAPMDYFTQNRIALYPGKVVEYNNIFNDGNAKPSPYNFKDGLVGFDFLTLMESKIEASTGAFKYMVGAQDSRTRTATETSATVTGQNTRLSMTISKLNREWTIPTIENIAALQANMNFEEQNIKTGEQGGQPQFGTVTPEVRQGDYQYIYGDSQSVVEMEAKMQKLSNLLAPFAGKANINWNEFLSLMVSKLNIADGDKILAVDPIDDALAKMGLPPDKLHSIKEQFVQSGGLQQVVQQMMMQQQGGDPNGQGAGTPGMAAQNGGVEQQPAVPGA